MAREPETPEQKAWRLKRNKTDQEYIDYIKSKCIVTPSGCWEWSGLRCPPPQLPYGIVGYRCRPKSVHRLMHMLLVGPIPQKMEVMHKCDNAPCCNPDHLQLGTHDENVKDCARKGRIFWAQKTECPYGHPYDEDNTFLTKGRMNPKRRCRECFRQRGYRDYHGLPPDAPVPPRKLPLRRRSVG
jgi:hypothetical protein